MVPMSAVPGAHPYRRLVFVPAHEGRREMKAFPELPAPMVNRLVAISLKPRPERPRTPATMGPAKEAPPVKRPDVASQIVEVVEIPTAVLASRSVKHEQPLGGIPLVRRVL